MEQTMGKRIANWRKQLGLTQDALAEKLGVTAQAVSKWENDQSCPDISMLPKLAKVFGITTDELLGIEQKTVYEAQVVDPEEPEPDSPGIVIGDDGWKVSWNSGKKGTLGLAVWVLLAGGLLLTSNIMGWEGSLWGVLWPAAMLVFGIFGLWPKFSFLRLGFALFGGYFTLNNLGFAPFGLEKGILIPALLLLLGLSLLADALKKKEKGGFRFVHNGKKQAKTSYTTTEEGFECSVSFGERDQLVVLPRLRYGSAQTSFGELELDLTCCESFAPNCTLEVSCSFGDLEIRVPKNVLLEQKISTSFGSVEVEGAPDPDARQRIVIGGSVSFGEITLRYV